MFSQTVLESDLLLLLSTSEESTTQVYLNAERYQQKYCLLENYFKPKESVGQLEKCFVSRSVSSSCSVVPSELGG